MDSVSGQSGRLEQLEGFSDVNCSRSEVPMDCSEANLDKEVEAAELYSRYNFKSHFDPKLSITGYKHQVCFYSRSQHFCLVAVFNNLTFKTLHYLLWIAFPLHCYSMFHRIYLKLLYLHGWFKC